MDEDLSFHISADALAVIRAMRQTQNSVDQLALQTAKRFGDMQRAGQSLANLFGGLFAGLSVGVVVGKLVSVQREFDVLSSSLTTVTGSSAAAESEMRWIKEFAATTPFALTEVTQAFVKMKALGLDASQQALENYGNTASAMGKNLNQLIEAVADAATGEFERLKEFGIKASTEGNKVSLVFRGVTTTIGKNADEITAYLQQIGNNEFAGAMALRAATLDGAISNLGDTWDELFRTVNQGNAGDVISDSVRLANGVMGDAVDVLQALNEATAKNAEDTGTLATFQRGLGLAFEIVTLLAIDLKYVLVQTGRELGALAAQAVAVATLDFARAREIGRLARADAEVAREDVERAGRAVVMARQRAQELDAAAKAGAGNDAQSRRAAAEAKVAADAERAAKAAAAKAAAAAAEAAKAANKELEEQRKLIAELNGLQPDYIEQLTRIGTLRAKATLSETEYVAAVEALIAKQPSSIKLAKEQAEIDKQRVDTLNALAELERKRADTAEQTVTGLTEQNQALREEIELIGLTERAQLDVLVARNEALALTKEATLAELERASAASGTQTRIEIALAKEISQLRERNQLLNLKFERTQAAEVYTNLQAEGRRFAEQLEQGLTDSLFRAFEAGRGFFATLWDGIKNLFKTTVLKAIIQPVVGGITTSLGLSSAANAATDGGGGISNLLNIGSNLSTAYNTFTGGLTSTLQSFGTSITQGFTSIGFDGAATAVANFTNSISAGVGQLAAAAPYALAAVAVLNALGVFRSKKIVDGGLQGELGGQINDYALQRKGGTLFSGPSYSVIDQGVSAQNQALQDTYNAMRNTVAGMAEQLGIGNDAIQAFTVQLGNDLIHPDTGGFGIKTQGLSQDEIVKKIEAALVSANEQLAAFALGTTEFTRDGETAVQTLAGLAGSLQTFNGTFKLLGLTLADTSLAGADATRTFIESFGGTEQFAQVASSFYQNFYTEAERTANTVEALRQRFFELGVAGATTREGFKEMVQEQQRLHGATAPVVVELLKLSDTFAGVVPAASSAADAVAEAARTFGLINTNSGLRAATEAEANAAADRRDLIAGRRAAEELASANAQAAAAAASEAAAQAATDAANARTEAERVLRQSYEAEIRVLDDIINARAAAVQALESAYNTERGVLEQRVGQFDDFAKSLRDFIAGLSATLEIPPQTTERLRAQFQSTLNAALGGDASAISALPGVGNSYVGALGQSAQTELELRRGIAEIAISTQGAAEFAEAQKSTAELQLESLNQQVAGLLEVNASVLTVSEAIAALEQASDAAVQAEAQKAILTAQVSSLITLNESVLSVRDAILGIERLSEADLQAAAGTSFGGGEGGGYYDPRTGYKTFDEQYNPQDVFARTENFAVTRGQQGQYQFVGLDGTGYTTTSTFVDNNDVARLIANSGLGSDREKLNAELLALADQLDASGVNIRPGSLFAGSNAGVDFRDLAAGGFGGDNFTLDLNAALKGPTGYGTLQANQQIAAMLGIANANRELVDSYRDLNFLDEGLGIGPGGTSPITTDELARYRIPGFASGGEHAGGWRMVGEAGRELEYTPPSRIFSNSQTNALLDNSGVEKRIEQLEKTLMVGMATVAKNTADMTRLLEFWNGDGLPETRESDGAATVVIGV